MSKLAKTETRLPVKQRELLERMERYGGWMAKVKDRGIATVAGRLERADLIGSTPHTFYLTKKGRDALSAERQ